MSDLTPKKLADLREQYREPIDPLDVDAWHTEMEGMRRDVVLPLIDEVENLRRWKNEAMTVLAEWGEVWEELGSPGELGESLAAAALAEVERRGELRAEIIERHKEPTTCKVWHKGELVFDGVSP